MSAKNLTRTASYRGKLWKRVPRPFDTYNEAYQGKTLELGYVREPGSNNPLYRVLIKQGQNASGSLTINVSNTEVTDMSSKLLTRSIGDPASPYYNEVIQSGIEGAIGPVSPVAVTSHLGNPSSSKACGIANKQLHKIISLQRRQFHGGVVIGELGKTVRSIVRPAKALQGRILSYFNRANRLKRGHKQRLGSRGAFLKDLADTYLEATFGWQPLISDVRDGAKALARYATRDYLERQQFRAFGADEVPVSSTSGIVGPYGYDSTVNQYFNQVRIVSGRFECIYYGAFVVKLRDVFGLATGCENIARLSGISLTDFAPTVWELIPWSFVVDYFTNVGDVIEAASNMYHGIGWITKVHIRETHDVRTITGNSAHTRSFMPTVFLSQDTAQARMHSSYRTVSRILTGFDLYPSLSFSLPQGLQWLNLAALMAGGRPSQPFY
jgi:hypothetical protein